MTNNVQDDTVIGDKWMQEKILQAMLVDARWAEQMLEVFKVEYFDLQYLKFLAEKYVNYAQKYKVFPSMQMLISIIKDDLKSSSDTALKEQVVDYLQRMRATPSVEDLPYIKDRSLDFCRKQALKGAFEQAIDLMSNEKYESVVEVIKKAVIVGTTPSLGHEFFLDYDARFTTVQRNAIMTGVDELDARLILNGGLGSGELGIIIGSTGAGKSHFLTMLGANALRLGKNVVHYTLELSEPQTAIRYDSNLCEIDSTDIIDNKHEVLKKYTQMAPNLGRLIVKQYPMNFATVYTLRSHLERCILRGMKPDMVIIDYADVMRSTRQYDSPRHELKLVYEELRSLAVELAMPVWSASQSNKDGAQSEVIDVTNMSEAYGKAFVADVILSISRRAFEKASGTARIFIAKNRAGKDGLVYPCKIDTARSKFTVTGGATQPDDSSKQDDSEVRRAIRKRLLELDRENEARVKSDIISKKNHAEDASDS